ncbi:Indoleacetamide hydrolase [Sphingomonas antarctica]|uniref:amidase family protein n=1 Tax=Sphingomonas antarctica TaxID=2040274 RepID=UPI0039E999BB
MNLGDMDALATAAAVKSGDITALEAVDAAIARAEALDPKLGFMVTPDYDRARELAGKADRNAPFAGVPFLIKDLDDYRGLPTRKGSRHTAGFPPAESQTAFVDVLLAAGLIPLGKSSTPEHGFLPTTEPTGFEPTRNPWDTARSSGGSSGGAASATAAHVVPFAHASDGGGSIRIPASCCGLFGLKPSRNRTVATTPGAFSIDLSVQLCVSRSVRDSAALLAAVEGNALPRIGHVTGPATRRLRIGMVLPGVGGQQPDADVAATVAAMADTLRKLGHQVVDTQWPDAFRAIGEHFLTIWSAGASKLLADASETLGRPVGLDDYEPFSLAMAAAVNGAPPGALEAATKALSGLGGAHDAWFADQDLIMSPVLGSPPVPLGFVSGTVPIDAMTERLNAYVGWTQPFNVTGGPAMSVPGGLPGGLPVGVQFGAKIGDERTLLELAYELEQALPWANLRPPVSA